MAVISNLAAITVLSTEENTVAATTPFADMTGLLKAYLDDLNKIKNDLTYFNNLMPAGSNKTALATVITNLA